MLRFAAVAACAIAVAGMPDVLPPGHKSARHEILIAGDATSRSLRLLMAPVHGFGSRAEVRPARAQPFSTKYGSQLWVLAGDEAIPAQLDDAWRSSHAAIPIPVREQNSVPASSPVARTLTLCRIARESDQRLHLRVLGEYQLDAQGRPLSTGTILPWLLGISLLGVLGMVSRARFERRRSA